MFPTDNWIPQKTLTGNETHICDVLCDLVPLAQFKKREKHNRSVTSPWVFFIFFKLYKW